MKTEKLVKAFSETIEILKLLDDSPMPSWEHPTEDLYKYGFIDSDDVTSSCGSIAKLLKGLMKEVVTDFPENIDLS